jgi:glycosyltransferase involved in cell wall biosynthesis
MSPPHRALKILDYTPSLGMGGIATGMIRVLETIDRDTYDIDFLLVDDPDKHYEERARELGSRIFYIGNPRNPLCFACEFFKINKEYGPFDVLHSHAYTYSGYMMLLGKLAGIPIRITHAHNDHRHTERAKPLIRRLYTKLMTFLINCYATSGLTISREAGTALFGDEWQTDDRWKQIPVGTDFKPFAQKAEQTVLRKELGLKAGKKVIGIVGRFVPQKNHVFTVDFIAEFIKEHPNYQFLFIGDGPLLPEIQAQAGKAGVAEDCVFAGVRGDLPLIYTHVMDAVLFPSLHEGLGRVAVEGQAAGLPVIASEHIPSIADLYEGGVTRLPLNAPMEEWVKAMEAALRRGKKPLNEALEIARTSPLSMEYHIGELEEFYAQQAIKAGLR